MYDSQLSLLCSALTHDDLAVLRISAHIMSRIVYRTIYFCPEAFFSCIYLLNLQTNRTETQQL